MFSQIFLFEIRYRLRRPAFYVYFAVVFLFCVLGFAQGDVPAIEKVYINGPGTLAEFMSTCSIFLLLVSSAIMGTPLYRDLEHNTKEYYLSYPITKAGYFWGRFFGSFFFVLVISFGVVLGTWIGSLLGPVLHWQPANRYGPHHAMYYLQPWILLVVPTLFFTSAFFFGLVAIFRNVKVIYSSGLFLFLGYILGNFFLHNIHNEKVIYLADPFLQNGMRSLVGSLSPDQLNHDLIPFSGLILYNRLLWVSVGILVLAFTWARFSFERFFSGRAAKTREVTSSRIAPVPLGQPVHIQLKGAYYPRILASLTRIELLNIIRDNYFWIILSGGYIFLCFVFFHGPGRYDVHDYPRTVFFIQVFTDIFLVFVFLIITFYSGETVHREKLTRFAFINDSLPPPDWVFNAAKLLSLCIVGLFLALTPMILGLPIQLLKGTPHIHLSQYLSATFIQILPRLLLAVLFCFSIHLIVNNKFAGHGVAITIWALMLIMVEFDYFSYFLLLYSYTPNAWNSDMDGLGHMVRPIAGYQVYWTLGGSLLIALGSLFFARGVPRSFRERLRLARQRFHGPARIGALSLLVLFLLVGSYIYYNVSYRNEYTTDWERNERKALVEMHLKHYASLPMPRLTRVQMKVDLFPEQQRQETDAQVTLVNPSARAIDTLLIDGDGIDFDLKYRGTMLSYTCPLYFPRAKFSFFRSAKEPSDYRLYILPAALQPGDTMQLQVLAHHSFQGFQNGLYAGNSLHNGTFTGGNLPGLGYDDGDELGNNNVRKAHGLAERQVTDIPWNDSVGRQSLYSGIPSGLLSYDLTVSTSGDQQIQSSGKLEKEWRENGRHYYHFVQQQPGLYPPVTIASARYAQWVDSVRLDDGRTVKVEIDYHPEHSVNLKHFQAALKDGLRYFSRAYGDYPYDRLSLIEASMYMYREHASPGLIAIPENVGWQADLRDSAAFDYPYYVTAYELATQWWGQTLAPNGTLAAQIINNGVPRYATLALLAQRRDSNNVKKALQFFQWDYAWGHRMDFDGERALINANKWYEWETRAALHLFGLAQTIGTDSLNNALRAFYAQWAFRPRGPYAGAHDLYNTLLTHIPDSLHNWFADAWLKPPTGPPAPPMAKR